MSRRRRRGWILASLSLVLLVVSLLHAEPAPARKRDVPAAPPTSPPATRAAQSAPEPEKHCPVVQAVERFFE